MNRDRRRWASLIVAAIVAATALPILAQTYVGASTGDRVGVFCRVLLVLGATMLVRATLVLPKLRRHQPSVGLSLLVVGGALASLALSIGLAMEHEPVARGALRTTLDWADHVAWIGVAAYVAVNSAAARKLVVAAIVLDAIGTFAHARQLDGSPFGLLPLALLVLGLRRWRLAPDRFAEDR